MTGRAAAGCADAGQPRCRGPARGPDHPIAQARESAPPVGSLGPPAASPRSRAPSVRRAAGPARWHATPVRRTRDPSRIPRPPGPARAGRAVRAMPAPPHAAPVPGPRMPLPSRAPICRAPTAGCYGRRRRFPGLRRRIRAGLRRSRKKVHATHGRRSGPTRWSWFPEIRRGRRENGPPATADNGPTPRRNGHLPRAPADRGAHSPGRSRRVRIRPRATQDLAGAWLW